MSARGFRRAAAAAAAALAAGALLGALASLDAGRLAPWSVPVLAVAAVLACELAGLARSAPPDGVVERSALAAVVGGRLLVVVLLAAAASTLALLAADVPVRHGLATGLMGIAAAAALFLVVWVFAARNG